MSLAINIDKVTAVLLPDGWHKVVNESFDIDCFEYIQERGDDKDPRIFSVGNAGGMNGATWLEQKGKRVNCLLTAIIAVEAEP